MSLVAKQPATCAATRRSLLLLPRLGSSFATVGSTPSVTSPQRSNCLPGQGVAYPQARVGLGSPPPLPNQLPGQAARFSAGQAAGWFATKKIKLINMKYKHKLKEGIELSLYRHEWYVLPFKLFQLIIFISAACDSQLQVVATLGSS